MCYVISVYLSEAVVHKRIKSVNNICYTEAVNDICYTEAVIHKCIKAVNDICYTEAVNDTVSVIHMYRSCQ